jgi:hypothetical protein
VSIGVGLRPTTPPRLQLYVPSLDSRRWSPPWAATPSAMELFRTEKIATVRYHQRMIAASADERLALIP